MVNIGTFRIGTGTNMAPSLPTINLANRNPPSGMVAAGIPGGLQGLLGAVQAGPPGVPVVNLTQRPMVATMQQMQRPPVNLSAPPPSIPPANVVMNRLPPGKETFLTSTKESK